MADDTILVWQLPGGFSGEDQHRLAHHRIGPILRNRLGYSPHVVHEAGDVDSVVARCTSPEGDTLRAVVLPAFRDHLARSLEAVARLTDERPDLPILLSGWGTDPDYVDAILQGRPILHPRFALARGEVEEALVDALERVLRSGKFECEALAQCGLALPDDRGGWRSRGLFRSVRDLDQLPSPYLEGVLHPENFGGMVLVEVARGCLFRCHFCLSCNYPIQKPRPFPISRILDEIQYAVDHDASSVGLLCSGLNYDLDVLQSVATALASVPENRRPRVESTIHLSLLDDARLEAILRIPWGRMIVGLQSTNESALALMHRSVDRDAFRAAIERIASVHTPVVELILGLPGDTLQGFLSTMRFVLDLPVDVEVYHLRLDPGSFFMRDREALGIQADFGNQGRVLHTPTFSADDLAHATQILHELGRRPWKYRSRRLGFEFELIHDSRQEARRSRELRPRPRSPGG